jgi:hypothetical protein
MPARSVIEETKVARYKVLKSVAHNIGHSFTSLMNYAGDDYVMGHILRLARLTGQDTLTIDFVAGNAAPVELLQEPISEIPAQYTRFFWSLVETHGSDRTYVKAATLTLHYDIRTQRPLHGNLRIIESPYTCDVRITDDRGRAYTSHFAAWWYPERMENQPTSWWKFWDKLRPM